MFLLANVLFCYLMCPTCRPVEHTGAIEDEDVEPEITPLLMSDVIIYSSTYKLQRKFENRTIEKREETRR